MEKETLTNGFLKLFKCFLCFLGAFLMLNPVVHADPPDPGSPNYKIEMTEMIKWHFQERSWDPDTLQKLQSLMEELGDGMPLEGSCIYCHIDKRAKS